MPVPRRRSRRFKRPPRRRPKPQQQETGLGIAALIMTVLVCWPVGFIMGLMSMNTKCGKAAVILSFVTIVPFALLVLFVLSLR